jgi:hypothetical protein
MFENTQNIRKIILHDYGGDIATIGSNTADNGMKVIPCTL